LFSSRIFIFSQFAGRGRRYFPVEAGNSKFQNRASVTGGNGYVFDGEVIEVLGMATTAANERESAILIVMDIDCAELRIAVAAIKLEMEAVDCESVLDYGAAIAIKFAIGTYNC
jgi:hypothetical protein